jgi:hypothetical protein
MDQVVIGKFFRENRSQLKHSDLLKLAGRLEVAILTNDFMNTWN